MNIITPIRLVQRRWVKSLWQRAIPAHVLNRQLDIFIIVSDNYYMLYNMFFRHRKKMVKQILSTGDISSPQTKKCFRLHRSCGYSWACLQTQQEQLARQRCEPGKRCSCFTIFKNDALNKLLCVVKHFFQRIYTALVANMEDSCCKTAILSPEMRKGRAPWDINKCSNVKSKAHPTWKQ